MGDKVSESSLSNLHDGDMQRCAEGGSLNSNDETCKLAPSDESQIMLR